MTALAESNEAVVGQEAEQEFPYFTEDTNGGRGFIVELLAVGDGGALKMQYLVQARPTAFWTGPKQGTITALYRMEYDAHPKRVPAPTIKPR